MILCAGEALIDMIPEPTIGGASGYVPHAGGAVYNTAIGLGRLGADTALLSGISRDGFGDLLLQGLADSNVSTGHVCRYDELTTLAMVQLRDGQATYRFYDENSAGQAVRLEHIAPLPDAVKALFIGGISLIDGPAAATYTDLAQREAPQRVIMMDPNIRPTLIQEPEVYRNRLAALLAVADIVKLSDEDLDWLAPDAKGLENQISAVLAQGPQLILLTLGSDGARAYHQNGAQAETSAPSVTVVDTVGAGDTFNAGALAHLQKQGALTRQDIADLTATDLHALLSYASRVAAVTVTRQGANPPWAHELTS
ncbi:carbohydrate kinase family protein [Thalassovita mediterranea]|jgi:fructokinase|uniref:2-dehydro-3-deoxygluconokinase n=2 Tax=Thalassovita mediterranea TaxID=340021 RepID=A0A0P1H4Q4_9RHOB|nr:carbohydrate kinase [Thalassovita mediterranea]CUH85046.1 2-dehydro-3-deoxygluconokinase [Thalassovita mediterranea]SIS35087.1 fructokinase [Thalassovita mediterranea]